MSGPGSAVSLHQPARTGKRPKTLIYRVPGQCQHLMCVIALNHWKHGPLRWVSWALFITEETEVQRGEVPCPKAHSQM